MRYVWFWIAVVWICLLPVPALAEGRIPPQPADRLRFLDQSWRKAGEAPPGGANPLAGLAASARVLMPEWEPQDFALFAPLQADALVWGSDPVFYLNQGASLENPDNPFKADLERYRKLGLTWRAANLWILTATERYLYDHPALQSAVCLDIEGRKILPPWLADADYKGSKAWWGCTNNPDFRGLVSRRLAYAVAAGANLIHVDDHAGTAASAGEAGCFCSWCLGGFNLWLEKHKTPEWLRAAGIESPHRFNYATNLDKSGFGSKARYLAGLWSGTLPLQTEYRQFQVESAAAFIHDLQGEAQSLAGRAVPFGVNAFNLDPAQLGDARFIDYFANELEHNSEGGLIPAFAYRLAEGWKKPVFSTASGSNWVEFGQRGQNQRLRGWIAQAYAFGAYFMYSWKKWGFTPATGTVWTIVPPSAFTPVTDFIAAYPGLFDGYQNLARVGLWYDNDFAAKNLKFYREINRDCLERGLPLVILPADARGAVAAANQLDTLILPDGLPPAPGLAGRVGQTWSQFKNSLAAGQATISALNSQGVALWALPRTKPNSLVVHLLNRSYQAATDSFDQAGTIRIAIPRDWLPTGRNLRATWFVPGKTPLQIDTILSGDQVQLTVPGMDYWGIAQIQSE